MPVTLYPRLSPKKWIQTSVCIYVQRLFFFYNFFFFKHVSVSTRELAVEGSGGSATDPITIDCSPAKSPTTGKADKIISIDSSPEPAKAKYLGYAGYGKTIAKVRAGSGKSAMTKKLLDNRSRTVLKNQDFPKREKYGNSDHSSNSSGESSESSKESEEEIQYYNGDTRFPMFGTRKRRFEAVEVLDILSTDRDKEVKCQHQPTRVQRNAAF